MSLNGLKYKYCETKSHRRLQNITQHKYKYINIAGLYVLVLHRERERSKLLSDASVRYQNERNTTMTAATLTDADLRVVSDALTQLTVAWNRFSGDRANHHVDELLLCQRTTVQPLTSAVQQSGTITGKSQSADRYLSLPIRCMLLHSHDKYTDDSIYSHK